MTYGLGNNDMDWVIEQQKLGFRGIITDDVPAAVQTVRAHKQGMALAIGVA